MRNLLQNKKIFIPICISVVVIMIAIVIFIVIGVKEKKNQQKAGGPIELSSNTQVTNSTPEQNTTNTSNSTNTTGNDTEDVDYDEVLSNLDKDYRKAIVAFVEGMTDKDTMEEFIEKYFDITAYIAYTKIDGDESKFLEEYGNVDEDEAKELEEQLLAMPEAMEEMSAAMSQLSSAMASSNETEELEDLDFSIKIVKATDLEQYNDEDEKFEKTVVTISVDGKEDTGTFIFYDGILIYMEDADGKPMLDDLNEMMEEE